MKISFVRHGESKHNERGVITGQIDVALTQKGEEQAHQAAKEISPDSFDIIYSSDLIRCKQTAEILNEKLGLPLKFDKRLQERNFGTLAGNRWEDIDQLGQLIHNDAEQTYDYRSFGGENVDDVRNRLFGFIKDVKMMDKGKRVLVVTHGGIIRLLHHELNNEVRRDIGNSSVHEFEFED
jgi:broad specificity phosphatase PhoE